MIEATRLVRCRVT